MLLLEIYGDPIPWKHHKGYGKRSYSPNYKEKIAIQWQLKSQFNQEPLSYPLQLDLFIYLPIPKATSGIKRRQMLAGLIPPIVRPDRTNIQKFYEDCLIGIVITDDSIIVDGRTKKIYGEKPKVLYRIAPYFNVEQQENVHGNKL